MNLLVDTVEEVYSFSDVSYFEIVDMDFDKFLVIFNGFGVGRQMRVFPMGIVEGVKFSLEHFEEN